MAKEILPLEVSEELCIEHSECEYQEYCSLPEPLDCPVFHEIRNHRKNMADLIQQTFWQRLFKTN